jgi:hypothetical protein
MAVTQESICNLALLSLGQEPITSITDATDPHAVKLNSIFDTRLKFLLGMKIDQKGNGWRFNRKRAELTAIHKITLAAAPAPSSFAVGATLTGASSGVTCTVKKVESSTVYWVTEPSGDGFTDGETIGDGTNTAAGAAGYPEIDTTPPLFGGWNYVFALPDDYLTNLRLIDRCSDEIDYPFHLEGKLIHTNITNAYARYSKYESSVTDLPGWFENLFAMDLAKFLAPKFVGKDQYIRISAEKNLKEAWMDAISGNGGDSYWEGPGRDSQGNTDVYEGARVWDLYEQYYVTD